MILTTNWRSLPVHLSFVNNQIACHQNILAVWGSLVQDK